MTRATVRAGGIWAKTWTWSGITPTAKIVTSISRDVSAMAY